MKVELDRKGIISLLKIMKQLTKDQFHHQLQLCSKKGHKLRENNFGVVWCVRCGLLSTSVGIAEKLNSDEQLIIK